MSEKNNIFDIAKNEILKATIPEKEKSKILSNILRLQNTEINLIVTGATGCGKSSTINALFNTEKAKVGTGVDPETMTIQKYVLNNLVIWDSPGLGDGKDADNRHARNIINKLNEKDDDGNALIDLILVILDGSSRDLGTSYELINQVIIPNLGENTDRLLVAINQADVAMKGRYWDSVKNEPQKQLKDFLDEKVISVRQRVKESTGIDIEPIYYSAGYKEEGFPQGRPYNLSKLLYFIMKHTPEQKRAVYASDISKDTEMWKNNDELENYNEKIGISIVGGFKGAATGAAAGAAAGAAIGAVIPVVGPLIGSIFGGIGGAILGFFDGL